MSNSSVGIRLHPVVEALAAVDEALDSAADAAVWALSDEELAGVIGRCQQLSARQAELKLRLLAEADGRDLGRRLGAASTGVAARPVPHPPGRGPRPGGRGQPDRRRRRRPG